jgi:hypothetical protein
MPMAVGNKETVSETLLTITGLKKTASETLPRLPGELSLVCETVNRTSGKLSLVCVTMNHITGKLLQSNEALSGLIGKLSQSSENLPRFAGGCSKSAVYLLADALQPSVFSHSVKHCLRWLLTAKRLVFLNNQKTVFVNTHWEMHKNRKNALKKMVGFIPKSGG